MSGHLAPFPTAAICCSVRRTTSLHQYHGDTRKQICFARVLLSLSFGCYCGIGTLPHSCSFYNHSCIRIAKYFPPARYNADNDGDDDDEERPLSKRGVGRK
uniref:(northern house mosquito) hypothetical protein n=1 Tax=Culex pipiens TaxID=7175 RepID=A0A8D8BDB4_CULPI